jgi:carbon monoxide dehydrogenase subunit G
MELTNDFRVTASPPKAWAVLTDVERIAPMLPGAQLQEIEGDDFRGIVKVKVGPITAQYKGTAAFAERNETDGRMVLKASGRDTRGQGNASATITATLVPDGDGTRVTVVTDLTVTGKVAQFGRGVLADVSAKLIGQFVNALEADLQKDGASSDPVPAEPVPVAASPADAESASVAAPSADAAQAAGAVAAAAGPVPVGSAPAGAPSAAAASAAAGSGAAGSGAAGSGAAGSGAAGSGAAGSGAAADPAPAEPRIRKIDSPEPEPVDLLDAAGGSVAKRLVPLLGGLGVLILILLIGRSRRG